MEIRTVCFNANEATDNTLPTFPGKVCSLVLSLAGARPTRTCEQRGPLGAKLACRGAAVGPG